MHKTTSIFLFKQNYLLFMSGINKQVDADKQHKNNAVGVILIPHKG